MAKHDTRLDTTAPIGYNVNGAALKLARRLTMLPMGTHLIVLTRLKDRWLVSIEEMTTEIVTSTHQ